MSSISIVVLALGCATGQLEAVGATVQDATVTSRVEAKFLVNKHINPFDINTSTDDGIVTLTGGVREESQKILAGELAASFEGVRGVRNEIIVVPPTPNMAPKRTWIRRIRDKGINTSIRSRLLYHKELKALRIGVKSESGRVTLFGVVKSPGQRDRIEHIAFMNKGVREVVNNLTVENKYEDNGRKNHLSSHIADEWVEKRVETSIIINRRLTIRRLDVEVNRGTCILTGIVDSKPEKQLAGMLAENIVGVREIKNDIQVRGITTDYAATPKMEPGFAETQMEALEPFEPLPPPRYSDASLIR